MGFFKILDAVIQVISSLEYDDNGHPYRDDDGGWIPNNEYDLDGIHYETDDNGNVYRANGKYFPNDVFVLDGEVSTTDENGELNDE